VQVDNFSKMDKWKFGKGAWPGSRDPYKIWHVLKHISQTSKARNLKFSIWMHINNFYKISEKGHGLGHVTPIKFGTPSNISPKWVKLQNWNSARGCTWTISRKWTNKISENGRGLGFVTLRIFSIHIWSRNPSWCKGYARQQCVCEGPYGTNLSSL